MNEGALKNSDLSVIQMISCSDPEKNLETLQRLLAALSPTPNQLVLLPENVLSLTNDDNYFSLAEKLGEGEYQKQLANLARHYQCYLICGSFPIKNTSGMDQNKIFTSSLVFSPQGVLISHYHKIHLFDAQVADAREVYKESERFMAGQELQIFDWQRREESVKVGLAICYDLRFPALFQLLRAQGAEIILLPAAFTKVTGEAHWQPLLQARAIENQSYILAANQGGTHQCGRETYGHSMIISPWGEILKQLQVGEGFLQCRFDKALIEGVRSSMPIISHNRFNHSLRK